MAWLRLQWRGALVVLAAWAGLAAAQSPPTQVLPSAPAVPGAAPAPAAPKVSVAKAGARDRIVIVNENGKSIRCRVVQMWRLADGTTAHQLQAIDSGELITILDDPRPVMGAHAGLAKQIFHWGLRNSRTPPPGSPLPPIPPELVVDSGLVLHEEINPPPPGGKIVRVQALATASPRPSPVAAPANPTCEACRTLPDPATLTGGSSPYGVGNKTGFSVPPPQPALTANPTGSSPYASAGSSPRTIASAAPISPTTPFAPVASTSPYASFGSSRNTVPPVPLVPAVGPIAAPAPVAAAPIETPAPVAAAPIEAPAPAPVAPAPIAATAPTVQITATAPVVPIAPPPVPTPPPVAPVAPVVVQPVSPATAISKPTAPAVQTVVQPVPPAAPDCPAMACKDVTPSASATPTMGDRLRGWFTAKSQPTPTADVKCLPVEETKAASVSVAPTRSLPPTAAQDQKKPVATVAAPSSAQPVRPEIVRSVTDVDIVKSLRKSDGESPVTTVAAPAAVAPAAPAAVAPAAPATPAAMAATAKSTPPADPAANIDILASPERLTPREGRAKANTIGLAHTADAKNAPPISSPVTVVANSLPPGAQSVLAARVGLDGPIAYIPVQTPVVPQPWRAPVPPDPKTPDAPQLNAFINAFTPPAPPRGQNNPMMNGPMMAYGYPQPGAGGPMMAGPMPPYAMMNPYMPPPGMMPYGYPMPPQAAVPANSPRAYQGPLPPNPFGTNVPTGMQQVSYVQPPVAYAQAPLPVPQIPEAQLNMQVVQLMNTLRDSPYPAHREMAANYLSTYNWRANPDIAAALLQAARQDPAATVRAGCVLNLMRMDVATPPVLNLVQAMRTDADPRVRDAAEQAIVRLSRAQGSAKTN